MYLIYLSIYLSIYIYNIYIYNIYIYIYIYISAYSILQRCYLVTKTLTEMVALVQWNVDHKVSFQTSWLVQNYYYVTFSFLCRSKLKEKKNTKLYIFKIISISWNKLHQISEPKISIHVLCMIQHTELGFQHFQDSLFVKYLAGVIFRVLLLLLWSAC